MINYETLLFEIAPHVKKVMIAAKALNNRHFLRGRSGWGIRDVENPESDYEHSCKVGLAAWYLFGTKKALHMGISHDFPEIIAPDRLPGEISKIERKKEELEAMQTLRHILPNGDYWFNLWQDFENEVGIGKVIRELDKICPSIQALDEIKNSNGIIIKLQEFYPDSRKSINTPKLVNLLDKMYSGNLPENETAYQTYFDSLKRIRLDL